MDTHEKRSLEQSLCEAYQTCQQDVFGRAARDLKASIVKENVVFLSKGDPLAEKHLTLRGVRLDRVICKWNEWPIRMLCWK